MNSKCCVQLCGFTSKAWPAGPVLANKRTPLKGLLVVIDAIGLRVFDARCAIVCAPRARLRDVDKLTVLIILADELVLYLDNGKV